MARVSTSGSILSIGTTAADPSADTFKVIGEITDIGEFGRVYEEITAKVVNRRDTVRAKGNYDDGTITLTLNRDLSDEGQAAIYAARDEDDDYNIRIELNDALKTGAGPHHGTRFDFKAKVFSFTTKLGGSNSFVGATVKLGISGDVTTAAAA